MDMGTGFGIQIDSTRGDFYVPWILGGLGYDTSPAEYGEFDVFGCLLEHNKPCFYLKI